jgi:type VI secretion system protein ImpA
MSLDTARILAPIAGDSPTGNNLRVDETGGASYYRIKDARSTARIAERAADSESDRGSLAPEWRLIHEQAQELLATQSKDLEVACWLTEAALRIDGYAGLRDGMAVLAGLVDRYWDTLHSVDDEDIGAKVAPLAGLNGIGADGSLIQPLRLAPLTAAQGAEQAGLWHYSVLRRRGAASAEAKVLAAASKATDRAAFIAIYRDIAAALASYGALCTKLDAVCGEEVPPASTIRNTLIEAQDALRDFAGLDIASLSVIEGEAAAVQVAAAPVQERAVAPSPQHAPAASGPAPLLTRDDALRELGRIATFFREHEPNSPTAYTLQTLIRRARLPLADLLAELIPDEAVRRSYLNVAGIGPEVLEK